MVVSNWNRRGAWRAVALALSALTACHVAARAQDDNGDAEGEEEDEEVYLAEFVEDFERLEGLFPLYRNPDDGAVYMEVNADQLGQEFIYFLHTVNGTPLLFHFRGAYRDQAVLTIREEYGSLEFYEENTAYYFDPDNALARAADANITKALLAKVDIEAEAEDGSAYVINASGLFTTEDLHQVAPSPDSYGAGDGFELGGLSSDKTKIVDLRSYPENTDVTVEYVYENPKPSNYGDASVTDARAVSLTVQHTLIAMPDNDFEPRFDDFRVGYFLDLREDLTSADFAPYRDLITRWDLRKANPDAAVSDPVEPVVFWIENTTPEEFREPIREGVLAWNIAFEAAGLSNALEVRVQPDDADWDAGDIRYNVLRWTSSPNPPFGGYGPSFTNPRTGQILGADVMLEYAFATNRVQFEEIYGVESAATAFLPAMEPSPAERAAWRARGGRGGAGRMSCGFAQHLQHNLIASRAIMHAQGASALDVTQLLDEALRMLTLHEVGHTLGLNHNMASSSGIAEDALSDPDAVPANSVMDYAPANLAHDGQTQGQYYHRVPGPYDVWAIQYGYTPGLDAAALKAIADRSTEDALIFGNDADDMRFPGINIDPRIMVGDLGPDSLAWAKGQIALIDRALADVATTFTQGDGDAYQDALIAYLTLTGQRAGAASVASRWVGGVYQQRSRDGQEGATPPFTPVPKAKQKEALQLLDEHIFGVGAFAQSEELLRYLQPQRRGFATFGVNEDPHVHARVLAIQSGILAHLLHPNVLNRMTDSRLYGGDYPVTEYVADLTDIIVADDIGGAVSTLRQQLQIAYVRRLLGVVSGEPVANFFGVAQYDTVSRSAALASLKEIGRLARPGLFGHNVDNAETEAHRDHILALIGQAGLL